MSVSRRLRGVDKTSEIYLRELESTIQRLSALDAMRAAAKLAEV